MTRLGIIPAAGNGTRLGGVLKELLPISDKRTMLKRTVEMLEFCDRTIVITNSNKIMAHAHDLQDKQVGFVLQHGKEAWGAIKESFPYAGDWNYYLMPDTYSPGLFDFDYAMNINFGIFATKTPIKYGVFWNGEIHDKPNIQNRNMLAWGTIIWSKRVVDFWKEHREIETHTQAFNMAIKEFGYSTYNLPYYFDIATFKDYKDLLNHVSD